MVDEIRQVYQMLEDEQSKEIYLARLNYLVSGDFKFLRTIIEKYMPQLPVWNGLTPFGFIHSLPKDRKIILYGAGQDAKNYLPYWEKDERFIGFCDRDIEKQRSGWCTYPVIGPEDLLQLENINVVISTSNGEQEIKKFLGQSNFPADRVFSMPVITYVAESGQYFNPEFMTFEKEEVFVDAGCFDLGTSLELTRYCHKLKKVFAFELDPQNYDVCLKRKSEFKDTVIELFPCGTWSESKTLHFNSLRDSSRICEDGDSSINVITIDEAIANKDRITFIKMDVEGSELESLKGAKNTILKDKPKLAICIYHKLEDIVEIPMYIKELVPEYKLYVRHHSNFYGETVLYAVMPN